MCHLLWGQHQEKNKLLLPWLWCWTMCRTLLSHACIINVEICKSYVEVINRTILLLSRFFVLWTLTNSIKSSSSWGTVRFWNIFWNLENYCATTQLSKIRHRISWGWLNFLNVEPKESLIVNLSICVVIEIFTFIFWPPWLFNYFIWIWRDTEVNN